MIYPLACALAVIGVNCWMTAHYGSPTPVWDHWDAEGAILYLKYLGGTLQVSDLIAPHCCSRWEAIGILSCKWWRTR